jgi:hypothetical protein
MRETISTHRIFVGKPVKSPLRRPRRRWEDNFKIDLREESCNDGSG